ncbi:hypothetical protein K439DRAFT_1610171 [Ramaria rubella]|nr:hypothetical protein K439DRAFT_1610171 [Ramaria rubella]
MSRLISRAPFNRPPVLDALPTRPVPLSPPETETEPVANMPNEDNYVPPEFQQATTESPMARFRRVSTVAYNSSTLSNREGRISQKQSRWLVMVMPPASLTREPPVLGHTLSSAPAGRFSNGILMPLFPTLYGQLTAIAREFNMPSTTGVCVYLQLQENGTPLLTPRISDESWQLLWGHFFIGDERAAPLPPHGLPISGRIEFDIDLRKAKWFNSWIGHSVKERTDSEIMSREPSFVPSHWRGESRTSLFPTELPSEESLSPPEANANPPGTAQSSRTVVPRQLPKPLLLERRDSVSVRSFSRHQSRAPSVSHEFVSSEQPAHTASVLSVEPTFVPNALSPVVLEQEEPQTAKKAELDSIVRQWRQSSVIGATSTALAAAGQPSLDPVNMPSGTDVELDLNDFGWSISSAGPPSDSPSSTGWPEPLPSVHLQTRLAGSVCLTPSVCTSFGPLDYDWPESPVSFVSRRPSPDLGLRIMDFVPLTLTTATSWGPEDLESPSLGVFDDEYRPPSIDLGIRGMGSRPVTPSTATSWGPADSPLFPPESPYYVRTPDAGERTFPDVETRLETAVVPVFPYYSAWTTQPWGNVWPYQGHRRQDGEPVILSTPVLRGRDKALLPEWPDFASLYPSDPSIEQAAANKSQPVTLPLPRGYPFFELYPAVYPHNLSTLYPMMQHFHSVTPPRIEAHDTVSYVQRERFPEWPDFAALYPSDSKMERVAANKVQTVTLPKATGYPFFDIYNSVYPYSLEELYPHKPSARYQLETVTGLPLPASDARAVAPTVHSKPQTISPEWPHFAALYPANPNVERSAANKSLSVQLSRPLGYPFLEIYPTAYPYSLYQIYPPGFDVVNSPRRPLTKDFPPEYRSLPSLCSVDFNAAQGENDKPQPAILRLRQAYPSIDLYEAVYPYNLQEIYHTTFSVHPLCPPLLTDIKQPVILKLSRGYPLIALYEPVYPYNLEEIYPSVQVTTDTHSSKSVPLGNCLNPTACHVHFEDPDIACLYSCDPQVEKFSSDESRSITLPDMGYPSLIIYPPVYPFNVVEIYGPSPCKRTIDQKNISIGLPVYSGYPTFNLYPAPGGYPTFEIYPPINPIGQPTTAADSVKLTYTYPAIELYGPVYPNLIVYPPPLLAAVDDDISHRPTSFRKRAPTPGPGRHRMHLSNNTVAIGDDQDAQRRSSRSPVKRAITPQNLSYPLSFGKDSSRRKSRRTHLDLHLAVFAADGKRATTSEPQPNYAPRKKPMRTHHDLHLAIFGKGVDNSQKMKSDLIPEVAPRPPPTPAVVPRRSRSGTVSGRPALAQPVMQLVDEVPPLERATYRTLETQLDKSSLGRPRRPSVSSSIQPPLHSSFSTVVSPLQPASSPRTGPQHLGRNGTSVARLPSSPADAKDVLHRVRSMNPQVRPGAANAQDGKHHNASEQELNRSKSMSDANRIGANRKSIVFERAKMFTLPGRLDSMLGSVSRLTV